MLCARVLAAGGRYGCEAADAVAGPAEVSAPPCAVERLAEEAARFVEPALLERDVGEAGGWPLRAGLVSEREHEASRSLQEDGCAPVVAAVGGDLAEVVEVGGDEDLISPFARGGDRLFACAFRRFVVAARVRLIANHRRGPPAVPGRVEPCAERERAIEVRLRALWLAAEVCEPRRHDERLSLDLDGRLAAELERLLGPAEAL